MQTVRFLICYQIWSPGSQTELNREWLPCAEGKHQSQFDLTGAGHEKFDEMKLKFSTANLKIIHSIKS
jgi:carbonic anhydrase